MTTKTATPAMFTPLRTPLGTVRQPTAAECALVGRSASYSEPHEGGHNDWRELGDYVIDMGPDRDYEQKSKLAAACEEMAIGDDIHVIPAGIYVEE